MTSEIKSNSSESHLQKKEKDKLNHHFNNSNHHQLQPSNAGHHHHHQEEEEEEAALDLPFSTFLARQLINPNQLQSNPSIFKKLIHSLISLMIKTLAKLEDSFLTSNLYKLYQRFKPSFFPTSSTFPFFFTLIFSFIQIRKLWITQPTQTLIQSFISLGPMFNTLKILINLQQVQFNLNSIHQFTEIKQCLSFWLIFNLLQNLESIKLGSKPNSRSSPSNHHISIYPKPSDPHHSFTQTFLLNLFNTSRSSFTHLLSNPFTSIKTPQIQSSFPEPKPYPHPTHPQDLQPSSSSLPKSVLTKHRFIYLIFKLIFLKWCSSSSSRGAERIWNRLFSPFISLLTPKAVSSSSSSSSSSSKPEREVDRRREVKIMVISKASSSKPDEDSSNQVPAIDFTQDLIIDSNQIDHSSSSPSPRIRSSDDHPIPSSIISSDHELFPIKPPDHLHHHSIDSSSSSKSLSLTKKSSFPHDFRTPENAWDSLSFVA